MCVCVCVCVIIVRYFVHLDGNKMLKMYFSLNKVCIFLFSRLQKLNMQYIPSKLFTLITSSLYFGGIRYMKEYKFNIHINNL